MKKLVSLLSTVAMLAMLAVPASAALNYAPDEDGWYVITEAPTDEEVAAYAPTLKATTAKLETEADLKAISSAVNKKYKSKLASHDIYKVTYDMTDIGTFVNAYDEDYGNAFFGLYNVTIGFDAAELPAGYEVYALNYTLPDGSTGAASVGVDGATGYLNALYTAAGVTYDTIFPTLSVEEGVVVDAGTFKVEYLLVYPKTDATVTLSLAPSTMITYKTTVGAANSVPATSNITCDDIVLGEVIPVPTEVVVSDKMDLAADGAIGAAWDVTIKNFDSTKAYMATFTDVATGEVRRNEGAKAIDVSAYAETSGDLGFAVIMNLTAERNVALSIAIQ